MEFTFKTEYNQKTISVMAEALRKTVRKKRSRKSHVFGWIVLLLALLLTLPIIKGEQAIQAKTIITWIASLILLLVLIFEDRLNGYIAKKRMLTGMTESTTVFDEDKYVVSTSFGKSEFTYENIQILTENKDYFVFVFDKSHAQIYDKNGLNGGTKEDFKKFITEKTGKEMTWFGK